MANKEKAGHRQGQAINLLSHCSCNSRFPDACQPIHPIDRIDRSRYIRDGTLQPCHNTTQYLHSSAIKAT